jgi:hypothetical protein
VIDAYRPVRQCTAMHGALATGMAPRNNLYMRHAV